MAPSQKTGRTSVFFICFIFPLLLLNCSSSRRMAVPTSALAEAQKATAQAEQVGGREYAPLELRNASKKLEEARAAIRKKDHKKATQLVEQALVDAELAEMKSLSTKAQAAVTELQESIRTLRDEINRKSN